MQTGSYVMRCQVPPCPWGASCACVYMNRICGSHNGTPHTLPSTGLPIKAGYAFSSTVKYCLSHGNNGILDGAKRSTETEGS